MTSAVLLQHFLTGLRPEFGRQLLIRNRPANFADALKDAIDIEYALQFDSSDDTINAIGRGTQQTAVLRYCFTTPNLRDTYQTTRIT